MKKQVETMRRQHDELRALAAKYEYELDRTVPDLPAHAKCRWMLARLVSVHLAYEAVLYPEVAGQPGHPGEIARRMAADVADLGERLQDHVREWTPCTIADDWARYRSSSRELMTALRHQMESEERDLYPLASIAKTA